MTLKELDLHTLGWQQGKKGRFRMIEVYIGDEEQWVAGTLRHDWHYRFKYESGETFVLHFDTTGKLSTTS
jgi:hypothetical protein